ncbi:serine/threonine-protein kinase [Streptacidiphilus pinicola]|uniref:serine/threonine-protein kinase n=1 Tax=Streptacidiphilus pinicola TaxID=2219663 RepID=UPI001403B3C5|nr:serine/threonine-protein kinase [Streptacidiphilus pinicola]
MQPGDVLADRYELGAHLGKGGMGEVWQSNDLTLRRAVAVKVLLESGIDQEMMERFRREARVGARLQHPGITVVHDFGQYEGQHFMVMELLEGTDLARHLKRHREGLPADKVKGLPVAEALDLVGQAAEALAAAHEQQVVHRDLKPANLFLLRTGRIKICDFGVARTVQATGPLTASGALIGTPPFMAPEQWRGSKDVGRPTDIYALGCVLYALLTGNPPFLPEKESLPALMVAHLEETPPPLRSVRDDVPPHVEQLVAAMLAKEPAMRPDAETVAERLHSPVTVAPPVKTPPPSHPVNKSQEPQPPGSGGSFELAWTGREPLHGFAEEVPAGTSSDVAELIPALWLISLGLVIVGVVELLSNALPEISTSHSQLGLGLLGGGGLFAVLAICCHLAAVYSRRLGQVPSARPGWALYVGPDYIMTTSSTGRREFTWDNIKEVTIRDLQDAVPYRFTALFVKPVRRDSAVTQAPAGWPVPKVWRANDIGHPVCVLGPMTHEQRTQLSQALANHGGARWSRD